MMETIQISQSQSLTFWDLDRRLRAASLPPDIENDDWRYGTNGAYLRELVQLVGRWREAEHPADLRPVVEQHLQTVGLAVRVDLPGQPPLRGVAVGLDDDGRLLVRETATSGVVAVAAGDVTHLRYE